MSEKVMSKALLTLISDIANILGGSEKRPKICLQPVSAPPPSFSVMACPTPVLPRVLKTASMAVVS